MPKISPEIFNNAPLKISYNNCILSAWNSHAASQSIPPSMQPVHLQQTAILSQLKPIHTLPRYCLKLSFNVMLPSMLTSS